MIMTMMMISAISRSLSASTLGIFLEGNEKKKEAEEEVKAQTDRPTEFRCCCSCVGRLVGCAAID